MNPKHLSIRMDRNTGNLFLTEERFRKPPRRIIDITNHVYLALCADLDAVDNSKSVEREIRFGDGTRARILIEALPAAEPTQFIPEPALES